ncbi:Calcyphosin-2, partial [Fasciolopsis buskii]
PNALETYRSTSGCGKRKTRIWFTARLNIFDPFALYVGVSCDAEKLSRIVERRNSLSSWSLRTFTGLAFTEDSTFVLYEDHKIGKSTKPLPFLSRRVYRCGWGERAGQPYMPEIDIFPGAVLFVLYPYVECAPVPLRRFLEYTDGLIRLHILSVDRATRQRALEEEFERQDLPRDLWYSVMAKLHVARLPIRPAVHLHLLKSQAFWRRELRQRRRPIEAFVQLYDYYRNKMARVLKQRNISDEADEMHVQLCRQLLVDGLHWFRLSQVTEESVNFIWQALDSMAGFDGPPHFVEFMRLVFGDMTDCQRALVIKAFTKMDPAMTGHINPNELRRFYTVPGWAVKEFGHSIIPTAGEFQELLRIITGSSECPVEFSEFEVLYHGLTIALGSSPVDCTTDESQWTRLAVDWHSYQPDRHDQFERILRDQWSM